MVNDGLAQTSARDLDYCDFWSDEDIRDVTAFSQKYAATEYPEEAWVFSLL